LHSTPPTTGFSLNSRNPPSADLIDQSTTTTNANFSAPPPPK